LKIIKQNFEFTQAPRYDFVLETIENAARNCYQSESKGNPEKFLRGLIKSGHTSVLEHVNIGVKIVTDRGLTHEIVRHRIGVAYSQSSTRYCNYNNNKFGSEITVIKPSQIHHGSPEYYNWIYAINVCENVYLTMIDEGTSPQTARSVLPTCLATTIHMTLNIQSWRHFFKLRASAKAHPDMKILACELLDAFKKLWPVFFENF